MRRTVFVLAVFALSSTIPSCAGKKEKAEVPTKPAPPKIATDREVSFVEDDELEGLRMILREAEASSDSGDLLEPAAAKVLDDARTEALLDRVDAIELVEGDRAEFAVRKGSAPPPRTGEKVEVEFPPKDLKKAPVPGEDGKLEVMRFAPEGDVKMAPHLSVTFSRPMVAVTSQEEASETVPARLDPTPAGGWRWLGTRTLMFKPDERFPMATDYKVEIPAGTKSALGDPLAKAHEFEFSTPPVGIERRFPERGPHDLTPVIFMEMDQRIDPEALAAHVVLRRGTKEHALRQATDEEIAADDGVRNLVKNAEEDRWIALVPKAPLPKGKTFEVRLEKGAPSVEGPKKTDRRQAFTFYTYKPFEIERHRCGWNNECPPNADWRIEFNNPVDEKEFDPAAIAVEPKIPGMQIRLWGDTINISGMKQGRTRYTVTVPGGLTDRFGQTLGEDEHLTFEVGPAEKTLFGPGKAIVTLDPTGPAALNVHSINHDRLKVQVHRVKPEDWTSWLEWRRKYMYETTKPGPMPGKRVMDRAVKVEGEPDRMAQTPIDLKRYLRAGHGQFLVKVEPAKQSKERWRRQEILVWVQVTDLGLAAFVDYKEMLAWVTGLADGKGISGVELELLPGKKERGKTDEAGLARIPLGKSHEDAQVLVARKGKDAAIMPSSDSYWYGGGGGWRAVDRDDTMRWYTFDDRGLYRPGEEVRVKGWIRRIGNGVGGDVETLARKPDGISWKLRGPRGNDLLTGKAGLSSLSGFDISLKLPKDVNLGTARLELEAVGAGAINGTGHSHPVKIQEFRRPEFEVKATAEAGPWVLGEEATVTVGASYYAGGGLPNAPVNWHAYANGTGYSPPGHDEYEFGRWNPWWRHIGGSSSGGGSESLQGKTDALGEHHLGIHFEAMNPPRPMNVHVEATVVDVNRQAWTAKKDLLVHPSAFYLGLRTERGFVEKGDPIDVEALVVDIDGKVIPGVDATLEMVRVQSSYKGGEWKEEELDPVRCAVTSNDDPQKCEFHPEIGGRYKIKGTIRDPLGRPNATELRIWVAGGELPPARDVEQEKLTLVPEGEEYRPGQTASFLMQAPFYPADGVLTVRRSGLVREERFRLDGPTRTFEVPILEEHIPDVTVQVDIVGSAARSDDEGEPGEDLPRRVAFATGSLTFKVPPLDRTLQVAAKPRKEKLDPGGRTTIDLVVKDAEGKPVKGAELVVVAADESVLSLTGYELPDPIGVFYTARGAGVTDYHSRHQVLLADPSALTAVSPPGGGVGNMAVQSAMPMTTTGLGGIGYGRGGGGAPPPAPMARSRAADKTAEAEAPMEELAMAGEMDDAPRAYKKSAKNGGKEAGPKISVRTDFNALALFAPEVKTDSKGTAAVPIRVPDSLTRYRIMVVAVSGGKEFGMGESTVTARLPLMVRPSPPRFLNFGDRFELPVVVQNQTDDGVSVEVGVRATNVSLADDLEGARPGQGRGGPVFAGRLVEVPANDRVEIRFPAAAQMAGTARFQVVASAGRAADAANFDLPVWTPATSEAFATYGEIDKGAIEQPIRAPKDVWTQFGGLEITTSSTQLQALTDAVVYLVTYPYDCNEQIASRILAVAALRDVLHAFEADGLPGPKELEKTVGRDLERLFKRQNPNGGFSFWRKGDKDWPYLTIHVASAMARAKDKGYQVPSRMWNRAVRYLKNIESHIPYWYSKESKWAIRAYAINVLGTMGEGDVGKAKALLEEAGMEGLSIEGLGWILPVLHEGKAKAQVAKILRHLTNRVAETAAGAHFVTDYSDGAHVLLHSSRRADGIVLDALIQVKPKSDLVPKIVRGLLAHRKRGKWSNTQENAFVLLAMDRYFNTYEKTTPDFVARAWLGNSFAGEHEFKGRTTERAHIDIPMEFVAKRSGDQPLVLQKDGKGRMYYRIGMLYAPRDLDLEPADYGFAVERTYEAVDDEEDVRRDEDGTWRIEAGAKVRVRLTMVAPMRRYHVALVDPLPAGLEVINPGLAVSESIPEDPKKQESKSSRYWWWWRPWYEHQNMRDERVEAFASLLWDGVHTYSYVARATTPGIFVVPPTRAEEMYHPETFGRAGTDKVVVE